MLLSKHQTWCKIVARSNSASIPSERQPILSLTRAYQTAYAYHNNRAWKHSIEAMLQAAAGPDFGEDPRFVSYLMWEALHKHGKQGVLGGEHSLDAEMDAEKFAHFLDKCPLAEALLYELFVPSHGFGVITPIEKERVRGGARHITGPSHMLSPPAMTAIEWELPSHTQGRWELLFTSKRDGHSFQRLRSCVEGRGPTVNPSY